LKKNLGKILIILVPVLMALYLLYPTYRATELTDIRNEQISLSKSDLNLIDTLVNNKLQAFELERTKSGLEFGSQLMAKVKDSLTTFVKDSIISEKESHFTKEYGEAYESAKQNRIKLGLDLRGGMYVILEIDIVKMIEERAQKDDIDEKFDSVISKTRQQTENSDLDVIDVFYENFKAMATTGKSQLSDYFDYGDNAKDAADVDQTIIDKLRENEKDAVDKSIEIMRQRIDKYGISEPTIQKLGTHRIMLEMPGVTNEKEMIDLIKTTARLQFHLVKNNEELIQAFFNIDKLMAKKPIDKKNEIIKADTTVKPDSVKVDSTAVTKAKGKAKNKKAKGDTTAVAQNDTTKSKDTSATAANDTLKKDTSKKKGEESPSKYAEEHPFTGLFLTNYSSGEQSQPQQFSYVAENLNRKGMYYFEITEDKWVELDKLLKRGDIKELLPDDVVIKRGAKKQREIVVDGKKVKVYDFYAIKEEPELTGEVVTDAVATYDQQNNKPVVMMEMNSEGADKWAKITGQNIKKRIAIILDDLVYTAPVVQNRITGGSSQITGMENAEEARLLQIVLKAGALQVPVTIKHKMFVGPSLGEDSIRSGLTASALAVLLVIIFMLMYYKSAGFVANLSVIINVMIVVAILAAFHGTLSLPGIGGIILTIGMAVDANVLIYERIREELGKGRSMKSSIDEGFSKAMTAIIDSNITTLISGVILYYFGAGPIQGFALTLIIGIFATLFTQIVVSRAMIELWMSKGNTHFNFGQPKVTV
jgi:SecD/SecF fusion protein